MSNHPDLANRHTDTRTYPPGVAYMDGQYIPVSEAKIPVLDYGFLHSDATYDVVHVWNGAFFRLADHLERFFAGLEKLRMQIPYTAQDITGILQNCVALSGHRNAYVEFITTRGMSPTFSRDPRKAENRFIAFAIPFCSVASVEQMQHGLHAAITPLVRIPPHSVDPTIKNYHWLDLIQGLYAAYDQGAETAILVDSAGNISEGPGFNIFAVKDGEIATPRTSVLNGITRKTVFDICRSANIPCTASDVSPTALREADEIFITSTAGGIMPVTRLGRAPVGAGTLGPTTIRIKEIYWQMHEHGAHRLAVDYSVSRET